jgi:hypothetical protein
MVLLLVAREACHLSRLSPPPVADLDSLEPPVRSGFGIDDATA